MTEHRTPETRGGRIAGGQVHGRGGVEWLTPPWLLGLLGPFDLDPCAPVNRPWDIAKKHYTIEDDGLAQPWFGRVFVNPPYDALAERWLARLAEHGNGIALVAARTDTKAFHRLIWGKAAALLFIEGRVQFHKPTGELAARNGAPSVLAAYGKSNADVLRSLRSRGAYIEGTILHQEVA